LLNVNPAVTLLAFSNTWIVAGFTAVCRLAGLLHDIGHGPFGHLLDSVYLQPRYDLTHESVGAHIVTTELRDLVARLAGQASAPDDVAYLIDSGTSEARDGVWPALRCIFHSPLSADILDYLVRDALHAGVPEYGQLDLERITSLCFLSPEGFTLDQTALPAVRRLFEAKRGMYEAVYFHHTARAFEIKAAQLLPETLDTMGLGNPKEHPERYYALDDAAFTTEVLRWSREETGSRKTLGDEWDRLFAGRLSMGRAYETLVLPESPLTQFNREDVQRQLRARLASALTPSQLDLVHVDSAQIDLRPFNPYHDADRRFAIYDPVANRVRVETFEEALRDVPFRVALVRAYGPEGTGPAIRDVMAALMAGAGPGGAPLTAH